MVRISSTLFAAGFLLAIAGCCSPSVTAVPLSPGNFCENHGIPFYLPKPLLVISKNFRYIEDAKVGLTDTAPIPGYFDDQARYGIFVHDLPHNPNAIDHLIHVRRIGQEPTVDLGRCGWISAAERELAAAPGMRHQDRDLKRREGCQGQYPANLSVDTQGRKQQLKV